MRLALMTCGFVGILSIVGLLGNQSEPTVLPMFERSVLAAEKPGDPAKRESLKKFMHKKLAASSSILEGLSTENFDLISSGASEMKRLSAAEEWRVSNDAIYRQHSKEFQRVVADMEKNAQDKNLDGAALDWIQVTMSCIECHKWVRAKLVAEE